ncbi:MAG: UvrD-helicase domain-containing protein, partial [Comamonas sp.]
MSTRHTLDPHSFPLFGSRLIEASAGTGKTWTIAALYVRLVLGHQGGAEQGLPPLLPHQILVMTFTRAATRELSDRIRARLVEAAACFRGERSSPDIDHFLQRLLQDYPDAESRTQAAWQLAMAAECMDDAAIFTIDAWCQRMLREHAFDSGNLFDETLESDESQRLQEAAQDYWRQQCYPLQGTLLQWVLKSWKNFDAFFQDLCSLQRDDLGSFPCADHGLDGLLQEFDAQLQGLVVQWQSKWPAMRQWVLEQS